MSLATFSEAVEESCLSRRRGAERAHLGEIDPQLPYQEPTPRSLDERAESFKSFDNTRTSSQCTHAAE